MSKLKLPYIIILTLLVGCNENTKVKNIVEGLWTIDGIFYRDIDFIHNILGNTMTFYKSNCVLPKSRIHSPIQSDVNHGEWTYINKEGSYVIKIETGNKIFSGTYNVTFINDFNKKLLRMKLKSADVTIVCTKALFDYEANEKIIKEIAQGEVEI